MCTLRKPLTKESFQLHPSLIPKSLRPADDSLDKTNANCASTDYDNIPDGRDGLRQLNYRQFETFIIQKLQENLTNIIGNDNLSTWKSISLKLFL